MMWITKYEVERENRMVLVRILFFILFTVLTFTLIASASAQPPPPPPPPPPLPPFFSDFSITPTEIQLGEDLIISFVIRNPNNQSITWLSTNRIGDITQIIEIELESYESKFIWYRIIPNAAREYDVWIDGQTGTFKVISTEIIITDPLEELNLSLQHLTKEFFSLQTDYNADVEELNSKIDTIEKTLNVDVDELNSKIDTMETILETYSNAVNEQIEYLENDISRLQTNILYVSIATVVTIILCVFLLIKRTS